MFRWDLRSHFGLNSFIQRLERSHKSWELGWLPQSDVRSQISFTRQSSSAPHFLHSFKSIWTSLHVQNLRWNRFNMLACLFLAFINNTNWQWIFIKSILTSIWSIEAVACVSHMWVCVSFGALGNCKLKTYIRSEVGTSFVEQKKKLFPSSHHSLACTRRAKCSAHDYCLHWLLP